MTNEHYIALTIAGVFLVLWLIVIKNVLFTDKKQKVDKPKYRISKDYNDHFTVELSSEAKEAKRKSHLLKEVKRLKKERLEVELSGNRKKAKELEIEIRRLEELIY